MTKRWKAVTTKTNSERTFQVPDYIKNKCTGKDGCTCKNCVNKTEVASTIKCSGKTNGCTCDNCKKN